jgi:hypothetical protein
MSNQPPSEFAHTNSPSFINMLLNGPPADNVAFEYGHGFSDSFEPDYDLLTEVHTRSTPSLTHHAADPALPLLPLPLSSLAPASTEAAPALPPSSTPFSTNESMLPMPTTIITPPVTPPPTHTVPGKGRRTKFPAAWLEGLARVVYTTNPYAAKHGEKKAAWDKVLEMLRKQGMFETSSADTVKNKMSAMLAYFKVSIDDLVENLIHLTSNPGSGQCFWCSDCT